MVHYGSQLLTEKTDTKHISHSLLREGSSHL